MSQVRVRFAPSPTGYLHIGGVRTALYNWLYAKSKKGKFILRIEDTDLDRSRSEFTQIILEGFRWLNLTIDEGPYYQSERLDIYREYAYRLLREKQAYKCYCTPEEIEARKKEKAIYQYDRYCIEREEMDLPFAIRFRVPDGRISFDDIVRGHIEFNNSQFEDFVILRSNGMPTYNFAVVIDDALMEINYVIRGDDHISNTPKHILLYNALGFDVPEYAHLPMILGGDGKRLSKRYGAASAEEYKKMGILPDALLNYLARLGWSHGDQEIFKMKELIELFDLKGVNSSSAVFDIEKLEWVNSQHIKEMNSECLLEHLYGIKSDHPFYLIDKDLQLGIIELWKSRAKKLNDIIEKSQYIYCDDFEMDKEQKEKFLNQKIKPALNELIQYLKALPSGIISDGDLEQVFRDLLKKYSIKMIQLAQAVRVAITGTNQSPGIVEIMNLMGRNKALRRLQSACDMIEEEYNDND